MPSLKHASEYKDSVARLLEQQGIALTSQERLNIEIAEFGLNQFETTGLGILVYVNNDRYCAKELVMLPGQTCPEHRHPAFDNSPGKTETFRCRQGVVYLYVEGARSQTILAKVPQDAKDYYTVFQQIQLNPGQQYTIEPNTRHWFQAGPAGAIVSEFSSPSRDDLDVFTDPRIIRVP